MRHLPSSWSDSLLAHLGFRRKRRRLRSSDIFHMRRRPQIESLEERAMLASDLYLVTTLVDTVDVNDDYISLREAITLAATDDSTTDNDTIQFDGSLFALGAATITLGSEGPLVVNSDLTIAGPSTGLLTVNRDGTTGRILQINSGVTATIENLSISGGNSVSWGGGIYNSGDLTLNAVNIHDNASTSGGGGVYSDGELSIFQSTVDANSTAHGGGIYASLDTGDKLRIESSTVSNNTAADGTGNGTGGGILTAATSSAIPIDIINSTISGNSSAWGGGVRGTYSAAIDIVNCTITQNVATGFSTSHAGGIVAIHSSVVTLNNSIVAGNSAVESGTNDIWRQSSGNLNVTGSTHNVIGDAGNSGLTNTHGNQVGSTSVPLDAGISALGEFGGPTKTHHLKANSPAIDMASNVLALDADGNPLLSDQRGYARDVDLGASGPSDATIDVGASEFVFSGPLVVSTLADEFDADFGDGDLSLREAISLAKLLPGADSITFNSTLYLNSPAVVTLSFDSGDLGVTPDPLLLDSDLTIDGPDAECVSISGNDLTRVVVVSTGVVATIKGLTIRDGNSGADWGGGILNTGELTLESVVVTENATSAFGGAIYNNNKLRISNSTVSNNSADTGGALASHTDVALGVVIENSAIINNDANFGGAVYFNRYNSAVTTGSAHFTNSTLSGNDATGNGGAIVDVGQFSVTLTNSTVTNNRAGVGASTGEGGGIWNSGSPITLHNTILAGNSSDTLFWSDFWGTSIQTSYNNLVGINGSTGLSNNVNGNLVGIQTSPLSPGLSPLSNYGGTTWSHALLANSPAIDKGSDSRAISASGNSLTSDQRGLARIVDSGTTGPTGGFVDIGAIEFVFIPPIVVSTLVDEYDGNYDDGDLSLREALALATLLPGEETITFKASLFEGGTATITLSYDGSDAGTAPDELLACDLTIQGPGADLLIISGGNLTRVLNAANVTIAGVTVTDGNAVVGGGLYGSKLVVRESRVTGNVATSHGGGIYSSYGLTVVASEISDNVAANRGGGVAVSRWNSEHEIKIDNSTISGNQVTSSTGKGGGIYSYLYYDYGIRKDFVVTNSTITNNKAKDGGGLFFHQQSIYDSPLPLKVHNTIIAGNVDLVAGADDVASASGQTLDSTSSHNLFGQGGSGGIQNGQNGNIIVTRDQAGLARLDFYGGSTRSHLLTAGSLALDHGDPAIIDPQSLDQRGLDRYVDSYIGVGERADAGSVEMQYSGGGSGGESEITGSDLHDLITVTDSLVTIVNADGVWSRDVSSLTAITIYALGGDDIVNASGATKRIRLLGGIGDDELIGGTGNDVLEGGLDNDTLSGGTGNDEYVFDTLISMPDGHFGLGQDSVHEASGAGTDTLSFYATFLGLNLDLLSEFAGNVIGSASNPHVWLAPLKDQSIENVKGTDSDDHIYGNHLNNVLIGNLGDDTLEGRGGNDVLEGGLDNDTLSGGTGSDELYGGDGDDQLNGGAGDDILFGEEDEDTLSLDEGMDTLYGGPDVDEYVAENGYQDDQIYDDDQIIQISGPTGPPNHRPQFDPFPSNHTLTISQPFSLQLAATDSDVGQTLTFSTPTSLPAGANLTSGGLFTWTPTAGQLGLQTSIQVVVTDSGSTPLSDVRGLSLTVSGPSLAAPTIIRAYQNYTLIEIDLGWTQVTGANEYVIERRTRGGDWSPVFTTPFLVWGDGYINPGFEYGELFEYRVKARNTTTSNESPYSLPVEVPAKLRFPNIFQSTRLSNGTVRLNWTYYDSPTPNAFDPVGFRIERYSASQPGWTVVGNVAGNLRAFTDPTAIANEPYLYQLIAYTDYVESPNGNFGLSGSIWVEYVEGVNGEQIFALDLGRGNQFWWYPYLTESEKESIGVFVGLNNDFDEGNHDASGNLIADNLPDAVSGGHRIEPTLSFEDFGTMVVSTYNGTRPTPQPTISYTNPNRIKLWRGSQMITSGQTVIPYAEIVIEGIGVSDSLRDTSIELSSGSLTDTVDVTVVDIDLEINEVGNLDEHTTGAIIRRNNDFSKQNVAMDDGPLVPDYEMDGVIGEYVFDLNYETDYTPATLTWNANAQTELDILLEFQADILIWDVTNWDGSPENVGDVSRITTGEAFTASTDHLDLWIEGLDRSPSFAKQQISASLVYRDTPFLRRIDTDVAKYTVLDVNAMVDGNRNGTITAAEPEDRSLVFWYNSDREGTYGQDGPVFDREPTVQSEQTTPVAGFNTFRDSRNQTIDYTRDLEDFAALSLYLDPLLVNNPNVTFDAYVTLNGNSSLADAVQIRLFDTAGGVEGNSRQHVMDDDIGDQQVSANRYEVVTAFDEMDISSFQRFLQGELSGGNNSFIFEAVPQLGGGSFPDIDDIFPNRQVELVFNVEVNYGGGLSQTLQSKVELDLHDITEFYDTYVVDYTNGTGQDQRKNVDAGSYTSYNQTTTAVVNGLEGSGFNSDDYVLFVHGWNVDQPYKKTTAETTFKRLYWQGYSGRFGALDWPTFYDAQGSRGPESDLADFSFLNFTYNASELQAWRSGEALTNVLSGLRQPDSMGNVHVNVMAHSMGNYVVAEAMRKWRLQSADPLVDTYIAMQGAISAGVYGSDDTDATESDFDLYRYWDNGSDQGSGDHMRPYMSDVTNPSAAWSQSAATNRVNMFNEADYALTDPKAWPANNSLRPLSGNVAPFDIWPYNYYAFSPPAIIQRENAATEVRTQIKTGLVDEFFRPGPYAYEIMAFVSQANALPIGAKGNVSWFNDNISIANAISGMDPNQRGLEPNIRPNHSFQFHHDAATTWGFWDRALSEIGVSRTYDMAGSGGIGFLGENSINANLSADDIVVEPATRFASFPMTDQVQRSDKPQAVHSIEAHLLQVNCKDQRSKLLLSIGSRFDRRLPRLPAGASANELAFAQVNDNANHPLTVGDWLDYHDEIVSNLVECRLNPGMPSYNT